MRPQLELDLAITMPPDLTVLEIVAMSYLAIQAENVAEFEIQS